MNELAELQNNHPGLSLVSSARRGRKGVRGLVDRLRARFDFTPKKTIKDKADSGPTAQGKIYSRQAPDIDPFLNYYTEKRLLCPPYAFINLYQMYEESDLLKICISAVVQNVHGFGYRLNLAGGDDRKDKDKPEVKKEFTRLSNFFDQVNDEQSFLALRKLVGTDYEVLGNACIEVIRDGKDDILALNYIPARSMRMSEVDPESEAQTIDVDLMRNGTLVSYPKAIRFRRYAQHYPLRAEPIWFKDFGDTRPMDWRTGERRHTENDSKFQASEIIWLKQEFAGYPYGMPRWIGAMLEVLGRRASQYVNNDLFDNLGVPPFIILVSNGVLTDESWEDLELAMDSWRGVGKFNRGAVLESDPASTGLDDKGSSKIEIKSLNEFRKEDQMFGNYQDRTRVSIRSVFRIPPLYTGETTDYSHSTAYASMVIADQQLFCPERLDWDTWVNLKLLKKEFKAKYYSFQSIGPKLAGSEELLAGNNSFSTTGALSINRSIDLVNQAYGLEVTKYDEAWGEKPLPFCVAMIQKGIPLVGLSDCIETDAAKIASWVPPSPPAPPGGDLSGGLEGGLSDMLGNTPGGDPAGAVSSPNPLDSGAPPNSGELTLDVLMNNSKGPKSLSDSLKEDLDSTLSPSELGLYKRLVLIEEAVKRTLDKADHTAKDHEIEL